MFEKMKKIVSVLALSSLIMTLVLPVDVLAQSFTHSVRAFGQETTPDDNVAENESVTDPAGEEIKFKEFIKKGEADYETDWSEVDWDTTVSLPEDEERFYRQINDFEARGESEKIKTLIKPVRKLSDKEVMDYYGVPEEVQEIVADENLSEDEMEMNIKETLGFVESREPAEKFIEIGIEDEDSIDNVIYIEDFSPTNDTTEAVSKKTEIKVEVNEKPVHKEPKHLEKTPFNFELPKPGKRQGEEKKDAAFEPENQANFNIVPTAYAQTGGSNPVVSYYDGIEEHPIENILNYLVNTQNSDGSFGDYNQYEITAWVAVLLARYGRNNNDQYNGALNYLLTATPQNNREKAIKIRALNDSGQPYQQLFTELMAERNSDGGFGLHKNYASDVVSTLEVTTMLYSLNPTHTDLGPSLYYITTQIPADGGMMYTNDSTPSYYLIARTGEHLAKFKNLSVKNPDGTINVAIQDKINALLSYVSSNYNENTNVLAGSEDLVDKAHAYYLLWGYGAEADKQAVLREHLFDYSFAFGQYGQSMYTTIAGMKALAQPDLVMSDLTAVTPLQTGKTAGFQFKLKNKGYATMDEEALINVIVDNYALGQTVSCKLEQILLKANEEATVTLSLVNTVNVSTDTEIKLYVDSENEYDYKNNWHYKDFVFAAADNGRPAVQPFFVATSYELDQTLSDGTEEVWPGFNIRWKVDDDPRRTGYAVRFREKGTTQWNQAIIDPTWNGTFGAIRGSEDKIYEVTAGVEFVDPADQTKKVLFYNNPVEIKMSVDRNKYTSSVEGELTIDNSREADNYVWGFGPDGRTDSNGQFSITGVRHGTNAMRVYQDQHEEIYTKFDLPIGGVTKDVRLFSRLKDDTQAPTIDNLHINGAQSSMKTKNQKMVQVVVAGQDNIGIESADFYYWDVKEQSWRFIESRQLQNKTAGSIDWYLPKEILGNGYKLRAIAWDYQGNQSAAKEWGPFEVIDGTPPTGTIQVDGLPATGGAWSLGDTKTISWNINSANPIAGYNSVQLIDGGSVVVASTIDKNATSIQYTMPTSTNYTGTNVRLMIDVCDTNSNCSEVESTQTFDIVDNTPGPHAPWGTPWISDGNVVGNGVDGYLLEVFDDGTNKEFIYRELAGQPFTSPGQYDRLMYRKQVNGVWQTPVVLKEYLYYSKANPKSDDLDFHDVVAVKGGNGDIHIAYRENVAGPITNNDLAEIYYVRVSNGSAATVKKITNNTIDSSHPIIGVDSQNKVYLAWKEGYSYVTGSGTSTLHVIEGDGSNNWSQITDLSSVKANDPEMIMENDLPVILDVLSRQAFVVRKTANGWSNQIFIRNASIEKTALDQFTADQGKMNLIVKNDPADPAKYLWLDSIQSTADLESVLSSNGFTNSTDILEEWSINQHIYFDAKKHVYALGNDSYDMIYRSGGPLSNRKWGMYQMSFDVDWNSESAEIKKSNALLNMPADDEIYDLAVERNSQGMYHLFFTYYDASTYKQRAMHGIYDGNKTYFMAPIASVATYTDTFVKAATNVNDKVTYYVNGSTGGRYGTLVNSADYSGLINYRLDPVSPADGAQSVSSSSDLEWSVGSGNFVSYDVVLGQNWDFMTNFASGITDKKVAMPSVSEGVDYYWQVVAEDAAGRKVYSNPWRFSTGVSVGIEPEIEVIENGVSLTSGGEMDLGMIETGSQTEMEFEIKNTGAGDLKLTTSPKVAVSGTDAGLFTVLNEATTPVTSGNSTKFKVRFNADSSGEKTAKLIIANNDSDEGSFEINLKAYSASKPSSDVALASEGAVITGGSNSVSNAFLIDGSENVAEFAQTAYGAGTDPITIELDEKYILNTIRLYHPDADVNDQYVYRVETSADGMNWDIVLDRSVGSFRSWQLAKFEDKTVKYIRFVPIWGTDSLFKAVEIEAFYDQTPLSVSGLEKPASDVALSSKGAHLFGGQYPTYQFDNVKNVHAIDGSITGGFAMQYTPNLLPSQRFVLELDKHYNINKLDINLLSSPRLYPFSFLAEVSPDGINWTTVMDYSNSSVSGLQSASFNDSVVKYIRISGTDFATTHFYISEISAYYDLPADQLQKPSSDVALASEGAVITGGSNSASNAFLIDGSENVAEFAQTAYGAGTDPITIELNEKYILNTIRLYHPDADVNDQYVYRVETSADGMNWDIVLDRSIGSFRSWQLAKFEDKTVKYIRFVPIWGTDSLFKAVEIEAFYDQTPLSVSGLEKPASDVALSSKGAHLFGGQYPTYQFDNVKNVHAIDGSITGGFAMQYTPNLLPSQRFVLELDKHYNINKLDINLLSSPRLYPFSFLAEVSPDGINWTTVMDYSNSSVSGLQSASFNDSVVKYIRISGTDFATTHFYISEISALYESQP